MCTGILELEVSGMGLGTETLNHHACGMSNLRRVVIFSLGSGSASFGDAYSISDLEYLRYNCCGHACL